MTNPQVSSPNDFKVVVFKNATDFDFTPEMGCMFDSRPIFGVSGVNGIQAGESITLPYHVGHRLAVNLAKASLTRQAPQTDPAGIPTGVPLWDQTRLEALKNSFLTELYTENKPIAMSETDRLMQKVEELRQIVEGDKKLTTKEPETQIEDGAPAQTGPVAYQDKAEVIAELEKRGIAHDKRKSKNDLEKLLA